MGELNLWYYSMDRDDFQRLEPLDQYALICMGVLVAQLELPTNGFLPRNQVRRVLWRDGPADLMQRIARLVAAGFLQQTDDPLGWLIVGWLTKVQAFRNGGFEEDEAMQWGQTEVAKLQKARADHKKRQADYRQSRKCDNRSHG